MAIQSSTPLTQTSTPTQTSSSDADPGRDGSTTPLIPAFLIAGVLLAIIATMFGWRRVLRNRHLGVVDFDMDGGVGMPTTGGIPAGMMNGSVLAAGPVVFRMGRRYGVMRGFASGEMLERDVGPKPVLWDVWVEETEKRGDGRYKEFIVKNEDELSKWEGILPLSATFRRSSTHNPSSLSTPAQTYLPYRIERPRVERPFMMRQFFRDRPTHPTPRSKSRSSPSQKDMSDPSSSQLQVAVLIAMPDESTSRRLQTRPNHDTESASLSSSPSTTEKKGNNGVVSCVRVSEDSSGSHANRGQFALGLAEVRCRWADPAGKVDSDSSKGN